MADSKNKAAKLVGITVPKETNCGQWYVEVVQKAELVEYYSEVSRTWADRAASCCVNSADDDLNSCIDLRILHPATYVHMRSNPSVLPSSLPPIGGRQLTMTHSPCDAHLELPEEVLPIPH